MTAWVLPTALVSVIGLTVLHLGTVTTIRTRCGFVAAESLARVLSVVAFVLLVTSAQLFSRSLAVAGLASMAVANWPGLLVRATGDRDPICLMRREVKGLFEAIQAANAAPAARSDAEARVRSLQRYRSRLTTRVLDAIAAVVDREFADPPDVAAAHQAYDEFDAAIAELRKAHSW
jgi:hypothetical protein